MASFREICSKSRKPCIQLQEAYPGTDLVFRNQATRKAFRKSRNFDPLEDYEATVPAMIRIDAVISHCISSFERALLLSESYTDSETRLITHEIIVKINKIWPQ